jgi:hypothetical protein
MDPTPEEESEENWIEVDTGTLPETEEDALGGTMNSPLSPSSLSSVTEVQLVQQLQTITQHERSRINALQHLHQSLRQRVVGVENVFYRAFNLELYCDRIMAHIASANSARSPGGALSIVGNPLALDYATNRSSPTGRGSLDATTIQSTPVSAIPLEKPFSFNQTQKLLQMIKYLRGNPALLAHAVASVSEMVENLSTTPTNQSAVSSALESKETTPNGLAYLKVPSPGYSKSEAFSVLQLDKVARCIVYDIYESEESHSLLLDFIRTICVLIHEGYSKGSISRGSRTGPPSTELLRPNSITALLIKHFLARFGKEYLQLTLKYTTHVRSFF